MTAARGGGIAALVLFIAFACNMVGRGVGDTFMVFVLPLSEEFGWKRASVASVYSAYLLVTGLSAPLTGLLIDRWGPRVVYPLGLLLLGIACLLAQRLTALWQFQLTIGLVAGMGVSMLGMVPASMLISRWFRTRMSTAMGVAYAGFGTGTLVIVPLASHLIEVEGWRGTYGLLGAGTLLLIPLVFLLPWRTILAGGRDSALAIAADAKPVPQAAPSVQAVNAGEGGSPLRTALRSRAYWQIVQLFSFTAFSTYAVITQVVPFLVESGLTPVEAATAFGTAGLLSVIGIMASGYAGDRVGYRATATTSFAGSILGTACLLAFSFAPAPWLVVGFIACFGMAQGARGPIVSSLAALHFAGRGFATVYGTMFAFMSTAGALGTFIAGLLYDLTGGYRAGFVFAMACVLVAVAPFWTRRPLPARGRRGG